MSPKIIDLGPSSPVLSGVYLIIGEGLCSNIYVIGDDNFTIVDTGVGNYVNPLWPQLEELKVTPGNLKRVVLTHAHHDHAMGVYLILEKAEPKIFVHKYDTQYISSSLGSNLVKIEDDDVIETGLGPLKVVWTPGHTKGSICLFSENKHILFSGDTVFPDGYYGRYDGASGSFNSIIESLRKLTDLNIDTLLPGHGRPIIQEANKHILKAYRNASRYS